MLKRYQIFDNCGANGTVFMFFSCADNEYIESFLHNWEDEFGMQSNLRKYSVYDES